MDWDLVVILTFVTIWLAFRANAKMNAPRAGALAPADQSAIERAMETARRLEQRMETLERLLDEDAPGWRARVRA